MRRRPGTSVAAPLVATFAALSLLAGCGGSKHEAPPPPAAAPANAAAREHVAEAPAASASPAPSEAPAVATTTAAHAAVSPVPTASEPPFTPGTSLPGAIPPSPAAPSPKPIDALEQLQQNERNRADYTKRVSELEANVAVANASIADWQNTILAFKNPFRPRPQLSPEDQATIEGKDGVWRVAWAEGKLSAATAVRDNAQKALDDLKANPPAY